MGCRRPSGLLNYFPESPPLSLPVLAVLCKVGEGLVHSSAGVEHRRKDQEGSSRMGTASTRLGTCGFERFGDLQDTVLLAMPLSLPQHLHPPNARATGVLQCPVPPPHRQGLSEAELKDVLSLDDEVLQSVYQDWTPPSKELLRFPPLLWVRLRRDLGNYLARRPVDGFTLLAIAHRWVHCGGQVYNSDTFSASQCCATLASK